MTTDDKITIITVALAFLFIGFNAGSMVERRFPFTPRELPPDPVWFQKNDCSPKKGEFMPCRFELTPKTMTLKIVPKEQYDREAPPNSDAFARIGRQPCEIVVPAGKIADNNPELGEANWSYESYRMGTILTHEILHCYIGYWHPSSAALGMNAIRKSRDDAVSRSIRSFRYRLPSLRPQNYELNKFQY